MNLQALLILLLVPLASCADVQLEELKSQDLLLLNVAVKARLLEKLTEETDKIQFERNELVNRNRACLLNVSATAKECKKCVVDKCHERGRECQLSLDDLQKIKDKYNDNDIPGVDFLSPPSVVQEEIREIKETAEKEILEDVPEVLEPKGKAIMEKVKQGMENFHQNLGKAVNELPNLLPKIEQNLEKMSSNIDMNAVENMANEAADQISEAINDPTFTGIRVHVVQGNKLLKDNLPSIMQAMGDTLSRFKSAVGRFVGVVRVQAGTAWKQAVAVPSNQSQAIVNVKQQSAIGVKMVPQPFRLNQPVVPNGESPTNNQPINQMNSIQFPRQDDRRLQFQPQPVNIAEQNGFFNQQPNVPINSPQMMTGRKKRQVDVPCEGIRARLYEACHSYHFYCRSCMNEKTILEHECGRGALVAMVAIKHLDIQTGNDIVKYKQFANKGQVIKKVYYDKNSLNPDTGTYSRAYITVHIGNDDKVFGTPVLPDITNLKHAGFKLGDELWDILQNNDETPDTHIVQTPEFHTVKAEFLRSESPSSSAAVYSVVWGVVAMVTYIGVVAISVMV